LSLFVIIYFYLCLFNYELYFVILFMVFSVCEGALGLSIYLFFTYFSNDCICFLLCLRHFVACSCTHGRLKAELRATHDQIPLPEI
jgi:hypothetical protein